jgi:hypothetical protein
MFEHVSGMAAEEALLGTGQPIFGQQGDRFKQRRSQLIIQVHRGKLTLANLPEALPHRTGEFSDCFSLSNLSSL